MCAQCWEFAHDVVSVEYPAGPDLDTDDGPGITGQPGGWVRAELRGAPTGYFRKFPQIIRFLFWFFGQMLLSNLQVAYDVVTPKHHSRPGTVAIPLDARTPLEITLLANLITLTPGTLSLDVSDDRKTLYIHAMFIDDPDDVRRDIKDGLERRLLELIR
jgi:multicomponent Na+:H+ antiporter subunit E